MTTFTGKDLTIRWKEYVDLAGDVPQYEKQYRVEFTCATGTVVKYVGANENYGTDTDGFRQYQCTLTYEENRQQGLTRSPTINVYTQDAYGDWTAPTLTVSANNPQSALSATPTVTNTVDGATIQWTKPTDADVAGYLVYMDTTNPPTKDAAHLVYDGPNTIVPLAVSDYTTRYVQVAPYDQFGQDSLTYCSVLSFTKQPTTLTGVLTNESVTVSADSSGVVSSFSTANGTFKVYDGINDVSTGASVSYSVVSSTNVTISIDSSTGAYSVSAMAADNGQATLRATYHGVNLDRVFTITKARAGGGGTPGSPGADAKLITVYSDRQTFTYDSIGNPVPSTGQQVSFSVNKQNTTGTVNWTITDFGGLNRTPVTSFLSASTGDTVTMTEAQFSLARNGTNGCTVIATVTDGSTMTDKISVIRVMNGAAGTNGAAGSNNAIVYLYQRAASAPSKPSTTVTYNFSTNAITGQNNGWLTAVPAANGNPLYVTTATASGTGTTDTIASTEWATPAILAQDGATGASGAAGAAGSSVATVQLFKRAASAPAVPTVTTTYSFSSGTLSGADNGWTQAIPAANGNPLYVTQATALGASGASSDTIANTEWTTPVIYAQDGAAGTNGTNGLNNATVYLYQRAASAPAVPSVSTTYTFASSSLAGVNNGWSSSVPADNGQPCYVTLATASSNTTTDTIASTEWSTPVVLTVSGAAGATGASGAPGLNSASVFLYQRAASAPAVPSATTTYTFSTSTLSGVNNGWQTTVPASNGNPCYVTTATASSTGSTDTIANTEWATPTILVQDGINGAAGPAGSNNATVFLYQRAGSAPPVPSVTTTYTFSTAALSGINNGWSQTIPASNGNPCYVTAAVASSTGSTDTIAASEWATPIIMVQDGAQGATGASATNHAAVYLYQRSATTPSVPSVTSTWTFSGGTISGQNNGWVQTAPAANGNPLWFTSATALSASNTDTIASTEWSAPVQIADATTNPSTAPNRVRFSMMERGTVGWSTPETSGATNGLTWGNNNGTPYVGNSGTFTAANQTLSLGSDTGVTGVVMPVTPGERIYFGSGLAIYTSINVGWTLRIGWLNSGGAETGTRWTVASGSGAITYGTVYGDFFTVPAGVYGCFIRFNVTNASAGTGSCAIDITQPILCSAGANQSAHPMFNPGPGHDAGATVGAVAGPGGNLTGGVDGNGRPIIDFSQGHYNRNLDYIGDGGTYARPLASRLNGGRPVIDFSEGIHANQGLVNNSNISINSNGTLNGAGGGGVTIGGIGGGPWATYNVLSPQNLVRPNPNLFQYPSGVYDGRTPAQIGWGNATGIGNGWQDLGNGHTTWIGGGYYQTWRNGNGTTLAAQTLYPYYDWHWNDGGGFNVGVSMYGYASGGTFSPYVEFWDVNRTTNLGSFSLTYNSGSDRWEGGGATPTNTYYIRVVPRGIFNASSSYQDLTFNQIKIENTANGWVSRYSEPVDVMSQPGGYRQVGDQRNLPTVNSMNLSYTWNGTLSFASNSTTSLTISTSAASVYIGNVTVSYSAMSTTVTGTAGSTVHYFLYLDDPYYVGGVGNTGLIATTDSNVVLQGNGRVYVGQISCTYPTAGSGGTGGGGFGGGGGGGGCVQGDMWVLTTDGYKLARDVEVGDRLYVLTPDLEGTMWAKVTHNKLVPQPCWKITSASGIEIVCSDTTPITLSDNSSIYPAQIDGHKLPILVDGDYTWEECHAVPVGMDFVAYISCGGNVYAAGVEQERMIFTHNIINYK